VFLFIHVTVECHLVGCFRPVSSQHPDGNPSVSKLLDAFVNVISKEVFYSGHTDGLKVKLNFRFFPVALLELLDVLSGNFFVSK
jgi:hypothetical protein